MIQPVQRTRIFYGWWVILSCGVIATLSSASRYSFTMFFPTLLEEMGWTRASLGFGLTLHMWVYAFAGIVAGVLVDKYGARFIMAIGGVLILFGLVLASTMHTIFEFYIYYGIVLALGVTTTLSVSTQATTRKWFIKRAGLAMAFVAGGIGFGFGLIGLVAPTLIRTYGWRSSWLYLGMAMGIIIILLAIIVVRKDPESMGLLPDGESTAPDGPANGIPQPELSASTEDVWSVLEALKTRSYWCLILGYGLMGVNYVGISGHMAAWAMDIAKADGVPVDNAMKLIQLSIFLMATISTLSGFIGGPISDRIGKKAVFVVALTLVASMSVYATTVRSLEGVILVGILSGFFMGLCIPLWTTYLGDIFGRASLATLFSLLTFTMGVLGGSGPVIFGWIFDVTGSYKWAWLFSALSNLIIAVLLLFTQQEKMVGAEA